MYSPLRSHFFCYNFHILTFSSFFKSTWNQPERDWRVNFVYLSGLSYVPTPSPTFYFWVFLSIFFRRFFSPTFFVDLCEHTHRRKVWWFLLPHLCGGERVEGYTTTEIETNNREIFFQKKSSLQKNKKKYPGTKSQVRRFFSPTFFVDLCQHTHRHKEWWFLLPISVGERGKGFRYWKPQPQMEKVSREFYCFFLVIETDFLVFFGDWDDPFKETDEPPDCFSTGWCSSGDSFWFSRPWRCSKNRIGAMCRRQGP